MAPDRFRWADATGLALAFGAAALVVGGVLQVSHLIADAAVPPPGRPVISTPTTPSTTPSAGPDTCAQAPDRCHRKQ